VPLAAGAPLQDAAPVAAGLLGGEGEGKPDDTGATDHQRVY
jgi:hypothetical protein